MLRITSCALLVLFSLGFALSLDSAPTNAQESSAPKGNEAPSGIPPSISLPTEDVKNDSITNTTDIKPTKTPDVPTSSEPTSSISSASTTNSDNTNTTLAPITSTSSTTTTTNAPITTVTPVTTVSPITVSPKPGVQKGSWNVTENNSTCIKLDGIIIIHLKYSKKNETSHSEEEHVFNTSVPKYATSTGSCKDEKINLLWDNNKLEFIFSKNDTEKNYALTNVVGTVFIPDLNSTDHFNFNNVTKYFVTPLGNSYSCSAVKQVTVNNKANVQLEDFKLQAFKTSNGTGFDESLDCSNSPPQTPDIVPIIVGCVLAILIISILVAYLISRRRSQARGYLSM